MKTFEENKTASKTSAGVGAAGLDADGTCPTPVFFNLAESDYRTVGIQTTGPKPEDQTGQWKRFINKNGVEWYFNDTMNAYFFPETPIRKVRSRSV